MMFSNHLLRGGRFTNPLHTTARSRDRGRRRRQLAFGDGPPRLEWLEVRALLAAPTITNVTALPVADTTATLNATVNPNGSTTTVHFIYGTEPTLTTGTTTTADQNIGSGTADVPVTAPLTGLTASTPYYFETVATNTDGTTTSTPIETFTTTAPVTPPTVTLGQATNVTASGATLNAMVNPNGTATSVAFTYGTSPTLATGTTTTTLQDIGSGTTDVPVTAPLTGLLPNTTYSYRLDTTVNGVTTPGTTILSFTTAQATPPTVTTTAATNVTASGATLNATVNPNGTATSAAFTYGTDPTLFTGTTTTAQDIGSGTVDVPVNVPLTGLLPNTTYYYRAQALSNGVATPGDILNFTTPAPTAVAPTATTQAATDLTSTTATLHGTVNPQGSATTADFVYGTDANLAPGTTTTIPIPALALGNGTVDVPVTEPLTGLRPDTTYYYRVEANSTGGLAQGNILNFRTTAQTVTAPTITAGQAANVTGNGATLNATVNPNGSATTVHFVYGTSPTLTTGTTTTAEQNIGSGTTAVPVTAPLTGLQPGTTYYFQPVATSNGVATPGPIQSFNTTAVATNGPLVTNLQRFGFHDQPTVFVLTFDSALDPARAQNVSNYTLTQVSCGCRIPLSAAIYNPTNHTVTLIPAGLVYLYGEYQLTVNGTAPSGLTNTTGQFLSGQGAGHPGTNYVQTFGQEILAGPNVSGNMSLAARSRIMSRWAHTLVARQATRATPATHRRTVTVTTAQRAAAAAPTHTSTHAAAVDAVLGAIRVSKRSRK